MKDFFLITVTGFRPGVVFTRPRRPLAHRKTRSRQNLLPPRPNNSRNDQENARKARALIDQAMQALGGQAYLNVRNMQQEGRTYSFYHGRPTSNGVLFWRFVEYPDKERIEVTKQRDVAVVYSATRATKSPTRARTRSRRKISIDYLRRRRFSLETMLRTWINDPAVALFYDGNALAGNLPAQQVTLINSKNEAVSLYFDLDTHLPDQESAISGAIRSTKNATSRKKSTTITARFRAS